MRLLIHTKVDASIPAILDAATALGATVARAPRAELPGVVLAVFLDRSAAEREELLAEIRQVPGVREVELDAPQTTEG